MLKKLLFSHSAKKIIYLNFTNKTNFCYNYYGGLIMGRELRRKQAKKEGKSLKREEVTEKNQIVSLIKIIVLLIFITGAIYLISALFITKELDWFDKAEDTQNETNNSKTILASSIFKQSETTYYVYFYDFNDEDQKIKNVVDNKLATATVYRVDTSSALNKKYVSDTSNKQATTLEELKVVDSTIIKINNDIIEEYYEQDEIINNLK